MIIVQTALTKGVTSQKRIKSERTNYFINFKLKRKMKDLTLEKILNTEMENIKGGANDTKECKCESGAAAVVIVVQPGNPV